MKQLLILPGQQIVSNRERTFTIDDTKLEVPVATLSTQDNAKLIQQLKPGFKRTINWNRKKIIS